MPVMTTLVDGTAPVAADFNGNFSALNNAIGSSTSISTYTTGDTLYASGTNTLSKLTIGTTGQIYTVSGGIPAWTSGGVVPAGGYIPYGGLTAPTGWLLCDGSANSRTT